MARVFCGCCGELKRIDNNPLSYGFEDGGCPHCQPEDKKEDSPEDIIEDLDPDTLIEREGEDYRFI